MTLHPSEFTAADVREDFPALQQLVRGKPLVYFDSASSSLTPRLVSDAMTLYYESNSSNVHRGVHFLSETATQFYESVRPKIAKFFNANNSSEIVFTHGTTEAINLVAHSYGTTNIRSGDEIIVSCMEHHSNIVPWQILCDRMGARLRAIPITDKGDLIIEELGKLITDRTKIIAITHMSNAIGTINPIAKIVEIAHSRGVPVLVDGAQSTPHFPIDVQALDCDFYVCSGHKLFGPTGVGILYGKLELLHDMVPYQTGGDMITSVSLNSTNYKDPPYRFEAGTPNIAGVIGLGEAITYLNGIRWDHVTKYESSLLTYATSKLNDIPGLRIVGQGKHKGSILSFVLDEIHPHDIGTVLDLDGIAIRAGHHCTQPLMNRFGLTATARVSFAFYNTYSEIDILVKSILNLKELMA